MSDWVTEICWVSSIFCSYSCRTGRGGPYKQNFNQNCVAGWMGFLRAVAPEPDCVVGSQATTTGSAIGNEPACLFALADSSFRPVSYPRLYQLCAALPTLAHRRPSDTPVTKCKVELETHWARKSLVFAADLS